MHKQIAFFIISLLVPLVAGGQETGRYRYLVDATNQINHALSVSPSPDRPSLISATQAGCHALNQLANDKQFFNDLSTVAAKSKETKQERAELRHNLESFRLSFVDVEKKTLMDAGLNEQSASELVTSMEKFSDSLDADIDAKGVMSKIYKLNNDICLSAKEMQHEEDAEKLRAEVEKWAWRLGGVLLIAADSVGGAVAPPVAAGSIAVGAGIMTWGE